MVFCAILLMGNLSSCSKDDKDSPSGPSNSIVGTWIYSEDFGYEYDTYTLVFNGNYTGFIRNDFGTKASGTEQMDFDWSLTSTSDGDYRLSVIYKSGDILEVGPFADPYDNGYRQWNRYVTIAGNTLSIEMGGGSIMLFRRK